MMSHVGVESGRGHRAARLCLLAVTGLLSAGCGRSSPNLGVRAFPGSYSVTYRVVQNGADHWEVLTVGRPLQGSDLIFDGPDLPTDGARAVGGSISTPTELFSVNAAGVHHASGRQPGPPAGDIVLNPDIGEMLNRHLARDRHESAKILGQHCHRIRLAEPPSGAIRAVSASAADHDDICLSSSGLILDETWTYHGSVVLRRTAARIRKSTTANLPGGPPASAPDTAGASPAPSAAATVTVDPRAATPLADPPAPTGFRSFGPALAFRLPDPQTPSATVAASVVWAFVEGSRLITVEVGRTRGGQLPWQPTDTVTSHVRLRALGMAETAVRSDGGEVRISLGDKGWVRVRGTVALSTLVAYANRLEPAPSRG